jgi:hypothetical protein
MNQNRLKIILAVLATIVAAALGAQAAGQLHLPTLAVELLGLCGTLLGIFGASPVGRVVGQKERREVGPKFPTDDERVAILDARLRGQVPEEEITADERPSGKVRR